MNKMKKLLSVVLAVVLALSAFSVMGSAARTAYKTVDELTALDAYSPYGQVTRLSTEERTSIVFDALDNLLAKTNINMGQIFNVLGLSVTIDLTSIDRLCYSFDTIKDTFTNTLASIAMGIVNLGILESLEVDTWATGMSRDATANFTILSEILEFLSNNTNLVNQVFTNGLDLGIISLGDMSAIENVIGDLPGLVKGLVFPLIERWDDPVSLIKEYDTASKGDGNVESIVNKRVKKLFSDNMSITTIKYDADGKMTSEHTNWLATATGSAAPTASNDSLRYYYQIVGNTMYSYHIVDAAEAEALAKAGKSATVHTYIQENQVYRLEQEVDGSATYVWKAYELDENGNVVKDAEGNDKYLGTLKYYNDDSQFLPGFSGNDFDLTTMSAGDLLYTFIPTVFENMAPVVLNGSVKKALAEFVGVTFTYVGQGGTELDDAVNALPDSSNAFFTEEQGEYLWEWSNYAVINGTHYYRFENQIFKGDHSKANNYFDIINWDFKVTGDFMDEFVPANADDSSVRLLNNVTAFLNKVGNLVLLPSAATVDEVSGYEAQWTRPTFAEGNANLVENIKDLAQAIVGLAPQHIFGSDYATNERCYVELMLAGTDKGVAVPAGMTENEVILTGIAAHLVDMLMPSMTLPGKSDLLDSGAKVGAILAAVVREFAAYLAPEYDFDALIYSDFGATDGVKNFVTGKDSEYWLDVILTMGINVGYEYLRAFADMGEGTTEWNAFVAASGYKVDGGVYTEADLKLDNETANHWEAMVDYIVDWALTTDKEWCWKMANLVKVDGLTIALSTVENPWVKLDKILDNLLPIDEIITVDDEASYRSGTELEKLLRYDLILGIVDLRWDALINLLRFDQNKVSDTNLFRKDNVIDALATLLKSIVNGIFAKVGNSSDNFKLIPDAITDFDSLANQANLKTMIVNLVGAIYNAGVTDKGCDTIFPFLNFLLGWKTDPQQIKDPEIWTDFRNGNDYAYLYDNNLANQVQPGGAINGDGLNFTKIKVLNNSSGMLETHRNSSVTDHAYDIQIKSITDDATTNDLTYTYGDGNGLVSPYETLDIIIDGTYNGEESVTVTIEYDYVGKDGQAIGGTQYTSLTFLVSNQYEDSNIDGRWDGDDDDDYTGTNQYKRYVFTEDIYTSVTTYEPTIFYVKPTINLGATSKSFTQICANGEQQDCNGNITNAGDVPQGQSTDYFEWIRDKSEAGWEDSISDGNPASGRLYKAKAGVTAETEFPYGSYDMGNMAVQYGGTIIFEVNFIYYNDYDIYDIYLENKDNGYHANQGVAADVYNEYNEAWKTIVYGATYPMMTEMNGHATTDYVTAIQPYIPDAIERFETAKEAYETALADAQANAAGDASSDLPSYVTALRQEIDNDFMNGKEINFQDYNFYEYFNYNDVKEDAEALYRSYLAPDVLDTYHIFRSGIRQAELELVVDAEANATKQTAINASRRVHDQAAIDASIAARNDWQQPINTKLIVDDMTSRLAFYKQFLNAANMEDANRGEPAHLKFLEREIAFVEAQGLVADDYESVTWGKYAAALETAKAVAAGEDEFSEFNSRIYDVKYNLMVAYKQLLTKANSLIEAGGTADLLANIEVAEGILAMNIDEIELSDLAIEKGLSKEQALGHLIEGLGYYYQARYTKHDVEVQDGEKNVGDLKFNDDGTPMMYNLYDESAYEYADNDRPNKQANQAKVDAANDNLVACIAYFAVETAEPVLGGLETGVVDTENGYVYGVTAGEDVNLFFSVENGSFKMVANDQGVTNGTGATLVVMNDKGDEVAYFTLVIFGDVNGDGAVTASDSTTVLNASLGGEITVNPHAA
ncbi:MAG: hypothetical protein J6B37_05935 [Clostridia bacterium]|nr:hypothetical protein [Clostridia bacterium]